MKIPVDKLEAAVESYRPHLSTFAPQLWPKQEHQCHLCLSIYKRASHHQIFIPGSMSEAGYVSVAFPVWEFDLGKSLSLVFAQ